MSRYRIQIETGLLGIALCLAIILWTKGRAVNPDYSIHVQQGFSQMSSPVQEVLNEMDQDLKYARLLLITDPDRLVLITLQGQRKEYRYTYQSLWKNEAPVIHNIKSFHFEYRNQNGQLLTRANRYRKEIRRIHYFISLSTPEKTNLTNTRIHIQPVASYDNSSQSAIAMM